MFHCGIACRPCSVKFQGGQINKHCKYVESDSYLLQAAQLIQDLQLLAAAFVGGLQEACTGLATASEIGDETDKQCRLLQNEVHSLLATASGYIEVSGDVQMSLFS